MMNDSYQNYRGFIHTLQLCTRPVFFLILLEAQGMKFIQEHAFLPFSPSPPAAGTSSLLAPTTRASLAAPA